MFSYTVEKTADKMAFEKACRLIEAHFEGIDKEKLLEDVDGTAIQIYGIGDKKVKACNDYEVDAVYVDSEIDLKSLFGSRVEDYDLDDLPVEMPRKGEPKYDIRAIDDYCEKHGIDLKSGNGVPKEILDKFIVGRY